MEGRGGRWLVFGQDTLINFLPFIPGGNENIQIMFLKQRYYHLLSDRYWKWRQRLIGTGIYNSGFQPVVIKILGYLRSFLGDNNGRQKEQRTCAGCWALTSTITRQLHLLLLHFSCKHMISVQINVFLARKIIRKLLV